MVGKAIEGAEEKQYDTSVSDTTTNPSEWDDYVEKHAGGHYAQTSYWAAVKETIGWKAVRLVIKDQGDIVAGAQLLLHSIQPWGNICYVIKAPLYPSDECEWGKILLTSILQTAIKRRCILIVLQPPSSGNGFSQLLEHAGSRPSRFHPEHASTLILDLSSGMDKIKSTLKRQTYQSIRKSEREGIRVREGTNADIQTFHKLHVATSDRQKFAPYPLGYFEAMWQKFQPQGHLVLLLAEYEEEVVSSLLLICFRDTVFAYILGWSGFYSNLRPNHALFWSALHWAQKNNYKYFDFGGVDPLGAEAVLSGEELPEDLKHSPDFLKYGFGGKVTLYPPAYDYIPNQFINWVYQKVPQQVGKDSLIERSIARFRRVLIRN